MSRNTALVTDAAKVAAQSDLDDYAAGAAAHMGGDWSGHRQIRVHSGVNYSSAAGVLATTVTRMLLTDDAGVDCAIIAPTLFVANSSTSIPPVIAIQPQGYSATAGQNASFSVYAASPTNMTYQWQYKSNANGSSYVNVSGANDSSYNILNVATSQAGRYRVVVSNSYGSVTSDEAILTVT